MKQKLLIGVTSVCLATFSLFQPLLHAANKDGNLEDWKKWTKQHVAKLHSTTSSDTQDLKVLKKYLKDRRIVHLGEMTHGSTEINQSKVRIIRYLHEELDYDVLAFESGLSDTGTVERNLSKLDAKEAMKNSIYATWHTQDLIELFQYLQEQKQKGDPLHLIGFDINNMSNKFLDGTKDWIAKANPTAKALLEQAENGYSDIRKSTTYQEYQQKKSPLLQKYQQLAKIVSQNRAKLAKQYPDQPKAVQILEETLQLRIRMIENYIPFEIKESQQDYPTNLEDLTFFKRDRMMAENLTIIADKIYPHEKVIVWGHNYHVRKDNTKMTKDWVQVQGPNMGTYLPTHLKNQSYVLGIYAYSGASLEPSDNKTIIPVAIPPSDSIESIFKSVHHPHLFLDLSKAPKNKRTSWMYSSQSASHFGSTFELMKAKEQYDGIIWLEKITPSIIVK
ncbi:erythromycin esterase family protein [Risungbinella massiliensis]|uniref:erythromycin esterase family protein n=1 Tax=Risungbinella massiliensis TaxID=1329796 RepID=UPI0005CC33A6|nr:erythromycin esterase family protein [Risungbinella massiliensis]